MPDLFKIGVETGGLLGYVDKFLKVKAVTRPSISASLNETGDNLVATLSASLAKDTGLGLEQVRGLIKVKRATRNNLNYDIKVPPELLSGEPIARKLEGKKEKGFGPFSPGQKVIVKSQEDELVCMDCEELAAAGPMPVEVAMAHIPKHPECRCVIMPYVSKKRLPVTMTSLTGTSSTRRSGSARINESQTLRQLAQTIMDRTVKNIRIELK